MFYYCKTIIKIHFDFVLHFEIHLYFRTTTQHISQVNITASPGYATCEVTRFVFCKCSTWGDGKAVLLLPRRNYNKVLSLKPVSLVI